MRWLLLFPGSSCGFCRFTSETGEILARIDPTLLDLGIAMFSGLAGSVVVCRADGNDGVTALPGVAIAVALMPPLCTMGFGMGSGWNLRIMGGAGLLFLTNLVAIVSSAFLVFLLIGMNAEELADQIQTCRAGELLAQRLGQGRAARSLMQTGRVGWRFLVLIALLAAVAVPLKRAFVQVTGEALARSAVQQVVKQLLPAGALVSQQVDVQPNSISVRLFSTKQVSPKSQQEAEQSIQKRSGRTATLTVISVASQSELAQMTERLSAIPQSPAAPAPVRVETTDEMQEKLVDRISTALVGVWPTEAPLANFDVTLTDTSLKLDVRYGGDVDLTPITIDLITNELSQKLNLASLRLDSHRVHVSKRRRVDRTADAR